MVAANATNFASEPGSLVVSPTAGQGQFTTIATALAAASSGMTVYIRPGTYTENLTLVAGVNLCAFDCDAINPNVTIVGKNTFTAAGLVCLSGIKLQTNSDFFLEVSGSAASVVNLTNCNLVCSNATGISFTSSSASARINIYYCQGDVSTTGITFHSMTSIGKLNGFWSQITNTGASTTASNNSAGIFQLRDSIFSVLVTTSSTGVIDFDNVRMSPGNNTAITTAGTGSGLVSGSNLITGTASAISVGSGTALTLVNTEIKSSNANALTGAGTLNYGGVVFSGSSSTVNTTTTTRFPLTVLQGGTGLTTTTANQLLYSSATNTIAGLATANSSVLVTSSGGVPSLSTTLPTVIVPAITGNTILTGVASGIALTINDPSNAAGANLSFVGNGGTTPNKTIRVVNGNFQLMNNAYGAVIFAVSDAGTISSSTWGGTAISTTFGGTGQNFSASTGLMRVVSGTASALTYVAESAFTPALTIGGSAVGITFTSQNGLYYRIGNTVHVYCRIICSSIGGLTGNMVLTGLPVTCGSNAGAYGMAVNSYAGVTFSSAAYNSIVIFPTDAATTAVIYKSGTGVAQTALAAGTDTITNTFQISFTAHYYVG